MRRAWIAGIALSLILSTQNSLATPNSSPAKAGNSCNKLNQTQIVNSIKYTCIKSGKKLIWDKGAKVVAPKPRATPTPTPSSTPTAIVTPQPTAEIPKPMPSASPTTISKKVPQTKLDLYYREFLFKAWQQELDLEKTDIKPEIIKYIDPQFPKKSLNSISEGMINVLQKYGYLIKPNVRVHVIYSSNYDFEINALQSNLELKSDYLKEDPNWSRHIWRIEQYKNERFVSGGTYPINGTNSFVIYFRQSPELESDDWRYLGAHETTHLIQWMINGNFPKVLPAWWIEGQAQQVEEVLGNVKQNTESIDDEMLRLKGHFGPPFVANSPEGKDFPNMEGDPGTRTEFGCKLCATDFIYSRGKLAIDYLISSYSHEKVINFMKSLSINNLWWQSFESTFGISVEDFYKNLQDLVDWYTNYYVIQ